MPATYLIVTSGRTGSSILAHALAATGTLGAPDEHLTVPDIEGWAQRVGVASPLRGGSVLAYLDALRAATSTPGGGFGTKLHTSAIPLVARLLAREPGAPDGDAAALLAWALPDAKVVWSRRRDRVAGAVSTWRARATGAWARPVGAAAPEPDDEPTVEEVSELHRLLHLTDLSVPGVLARTGLPTLEVVYEDLVADWDRRLAEVRRFLGDRPDGPTPRPPLARQAGPRSAATVARWVAATGGCAACGRLPEATASAVQVGSAENDDTWSR